MAACDPQTLANQATCLDTCIPDGMKIPVLIYLWCQIATTLGVVVQGHYAGAAPTFTPSAGVGIAFDLDSSNQWKYTNGAWSTLA